MVTIEQKLTLFSKLLNQGIKEEMDEKFAQLEKEYEKRMAESKFQTDRESNESIEKARKRAEIWKVERVSKERLDSKKEMMQVKEEIISKFMNALERKILAFTETETYLNYLKQLIQNISSAEYGKGSLQIELTKTDYEKNQKWISKILEEQGISKKQMHFEVTKENILGGMIINNPDENTRMDLSISAILEEAKDHIVEKITRAIGEVGDNADES